MGIEPRCYEQRPGGVCLLFDASQWNAPRQFAYRPEGSLSRDYHPLAGVFFVSRYTIGSGLHCALIPIHAFCFAIRQRPSFLALAKISLYRFKTALQDEIWRLVFLAISAMVAPVVPTLSR